MKNRIIKVLSGRILLFLLLLLYAIAMAVATFVENEAGTAVARSWFYDAWWFIGLQAVMAVCFTVSVFTTGMFKPGKWGSLLFHIGFVVILVGAGITHFFGKEGIIHIREGEKTNYMFTGEMMRREQLPFEVELKDFRLERYPGSHSPSSYESDLLVTAGGTQREYTVLMNKVLDIKGYRLFQSSFDKDEQGTVLTVNRDRPGMVVSYCGYLLLGLGFIGTLFQRNSRFRTLNRMFREYTKNTVLMIGILLVPVFYLQAQPVVAREHADRFGRMVVQNPKGRLEPANTWTSNIARKITRTEYFRGMTPEQFFLSMLAFPEAWNSIPVISVKNKEIVKRLNKTGEYIAYNDLFNADGTYLLGPEVEQAYEKHSSKRSRYENDILKLDESVNILFQIQRGKMLALFPDERDKTGKWYAAGDDLSVFEGKDSLFVAKIMIWYVDELHSGVQTGQWKAADEVLDMIHTYQKAKNRIIPVDQARIDAEITYNKAHIFSGCFLLYLIAGGVLLLLVFTGIFRDRQWIRWGCFGMTCCVGGIFLWHTYGLGLRWYISGHAPWTNSYESMVYVGWAIILAGLLFARRSYVLPALASILAGVVLFVSNLNWLNPEITPLVPVLQSYWLMLHVAVIMAGYGFFFICALIGLFNLIMMIVAAGKRRVGIYVSIEKLTILNEMAMILGVMLMTAGTFLGAIWANESWGRYWGWDPKETWALISIVVYTLVLHIRMIPRMKGTYLFNLLSVVAIASVLMTYFGVNYYLTGLHAYGKTDARLLPMPFILGIIVIAGIAAVAYKRKRMNNGL